MDLIDIDFLSKDDLLLIICFYSYNSTLLWSKLPQSFRIILDFQLSVDPTSQKPSNVGLSVETFLRLTWNSRTHSHLGSNTHLHSHNYKNSNYCSLAAAILHLQPAAPSPSPPAVFTPQALSLLLPRRRKTISFVGGIIPSFPRHGPEQQQLTSVCVFQQMWV